MLKKNGSPIGAAICFLVGLFAITTNDSASAASACLASPNRESGPGTHWHYRVNQATKQRCWYLKKLGGASRPRPTGVTRATPASATRAAPTTTPATSPATASRAAPAEVAAPAESESSIKAWFTATFNALSGSSATSSSSEKREPSEPTPARKQRSNAAERSEQGKAARAQQRSSSAPSEEAAGDKDASTPDPAPEWQKALYEEFLQWRVKKLLFE